MLLIEISKPNQNMFIWTLTYKIINCSLQPNSSGMFFYLKKKRKRKEKSCGYLQQQCSLQSISHVPRLPALSLHTCAPLNLPLIIISLSLPLFSLRNERFSRPLLTTPVLPLSFQRSSPCRSVDHVLVFFFVLNLFWIEQFRPLID